MTIEAWGWVAIAVWSLLIALNVALWLLLKLFEALDAFGRWRWRQSMEPELSRSIEQARRVYAKQKKERDND